MRPLANPSAFTQLSMSDDLLHWIQEDEEFYACPEQQIPILGSKWQTEKAIDFPHIPNHIYYEGYGHGLASSEPIDSMNPRWGHQMAKHRAPARLVAFVRCFKELNSTWLNEAFDQGYMKELTQNDYHLSDFAMQFHWGDEISEENIGWHSDGPNSMLHMAISILGRRALHMSRPEEGHTVHWQKPGDFYIGTPFTAMHAVEYPECSSDSRVLAIQVRFLFPTNNEGMKSVQNENYKSLIPHVVETINNANIQVPTLIEVQKKIQQMQ